MESGSVRLVFLLLLCQHGSNAAVISVKAEVEHSVVSRATVQDPDVTMYRITFGLRLTNNGTSVVNIAAAPVIVLSVESRDIDGKWTSLSQNSWYDDGTIKYSSCAPIPPGGVGVIPKGEVNLGLLKKQSSKVGDRPIVRLQVQVLCRGTNGVVTGTPVIVTEPFTLRLSGR
jgi:hypothetical protein